MNGDVTGLGADSAQPVLDTGARGVTRLTLTGTLDGLTHFAVLAFAAWTLVYDVGLAAHLGTTFLLLMWATCMAAIIAGLVRFRSAAACQMPADEPARLTGRPSVRRRTLAVAGVILGVGAGIAAGSHRAGLPWVLTPLLGLASALAAVAWLHMGDTRQAHTSAPRKAPSGGSAFAACVASGAAIFSLYLVRPTPDDVYYVSRSVWTAQHGRIPVMDILFTNQAIKPIRGELPISSIEVLDGALARMLGIPAGAFVYGIALPVSTFIAVWGVWLLIRRWAPSRYTLCFIVAMVYLAWTGSGASFGAFHIGTMWEGKAAFVSIMVPLLYFYLTDWAENRTVRGLVFVIASGVAAAGLSSAAVLVVPLITAAVAVPLLFNGMFKEAFGAALSSAYPVIAGLVVAVRSPLTHLPHVPFTALAVWTWVMKLGVVGAVVGMALWTAPWLARRGVPALITAGIAGLAGVLMVPGLVGRLGDSLGISLVIWRVLWFVPGPVLVGLLAGVPLPFAKRFQVAGPMMRIIPAGALSAALVLSGTPVWSHQNGATVASHPAWKVKGDRLKWARKVLQADHSRGDILSTWQIMETITLLTTTIRVVNPRGYYLTIMSADSHIIDRKLLTAVADGSTPLPTVAAVRAALTHLGVGYACVWDSHTSAIRLLETAGLVRAARLGALQCLRRDHSG